MKGGSSAGAGDGAWRNDMGWWTWTRASRRRRKRRTFRSACRRLMTG